MNNPQHHGRVVISLLFIALVMSLITVGWRWLSAPQTLSIDAVRIHGEFRNLQQADLQQRVSDVVRDGFFAVDVNAVRERLMAMPWVREVSVRRLWPAALDVQVTEQTAVARWGQEGLLNDRGEAFYPPMPSHPQGLPSLSGPEGSEAQVLNRYRQLQEWFQPLSIGVLQLHMSSRQSWQFSLARGPRIDVGREAFTLRVKRLIRVMQDLQQTQWARIEHIDLRYTNGISLRWKAVQEAHEGSA